jgi:tetratricopeptide (TPR) repeat protein
VAEEDELIEQAAKLLKKKDKEEARAKLKKAVKINAKNERAWMLLADASDKPEERLRCLERADSIREAKATVDDKIRKLEAKTRKPLIIWNKTTRLRVIIGAIVSIITFGWLLFRDVVPTFRAVNRMTGEWNVAVAGFTDLGTDLRRSDVVVIGSVFSNRFSQEMEALGSDTNLVVQIWGPQEVNQTISGDNAENRAADAEKLAAELNADILIYGTIQQIDNGYMLQPEFYIRAENYYEADELIGQHRFGGAIPILATRDTLPSQLPLNIELARRSEILALVARGLSLYLVHSYDRTLELFTQANQDTFWQNPDGRETIYLFQGNAAIRLNELEEAKQAYSQAIAIKPEYGRGYIGLGNVYYLQAAKSATQTSFTPNLQDLAQAKDYFEHALKIADLQPESAEIPSKAAFGLGQIYMTEWFLGEDTHDQAVEQFQFVLGQYGEGAKPQLQELASEAHARLAVIDRQDGQVDTALAEFQQAIALSTLPARRGLYWASLSDLYAQQQDLEQAQAASQSAIEQYQLAIVLPISDELRAHYWAQIAVQYEFLEDTGQAIGAYEQALKLLPPASADYSLYQQRLDALKP